MESPTVTIKFNQSELFYLRACIAEAEKHFNENAKKNEILNSEKLKNKIDKSFLNILDIDSKNIEEIINQKSKELLMEC